VLVQGEDRGRHRAQQHLLEDEIGPRVDPGPDLEAGGEGALAGEVAEGVGVADVAGQGADGDDVPRTLARREPREGPDEIQDPVQVRVDDLPVGIESNPSSLSIG
jgi:hypothetical protein